MNVGFQSLTYHSFPINSLYSCITTMMAIMSQTEEAPMALNPWSLSKVSREINSGGVFILNSLHDNFVRAFDHPI